MANELIKMYCVKCVYIGGGSMRWVPSVIEEGCALSFYFFYFFVRDEWIARLFINVLKNREMHCLFKRRRGGIPFSLQVFCATCIQILPCRLLTALLLILSWTVNTSTLNLLGWYSHRTPM